MPEPDLWFAAPPPEDAAWDLPLPHAAPRPRASAAEWRRAEAGQGRALAAAAAEAARLDERLRGAPAGALHRLALEEAEALARLSGDRLPAGTLARVEELRGRGVGEDSRRVEAALWALRRLRAGQGPRPGDLAAFLGRHPQDASGLGALAQRPEGAEFAALATAWEAGLAEAAGLHPLTRAGLAFHAWRALGLSAAEDLIEPGTAAALIGAAELRGGLGFLPAARGGGGAHHTGGSAAERLAAWLDGVRRACLSGLMLLDRLAAWRVRAAAGTADLSGRTPPRLLDALSAAPVLSAEAAASAAGASRSAAERNLALLAARGLALEVTGQSRFRLWRAAL